MNQLDKLFETKPRNLLSIYLTAGYPYLEATVDIIQTLDEEGVDMIEVGMPYSDPMADGPTIQQSSSAAIQNGMRLEKLFGQLSALKGRIETPLVYMGYLNQIMQYGEDRFFTTCAACGISGLILPDLPLDAYHSHYKQRIESAELRMNFLIAPQTPEDRIKQIDKATTGFIYVVADAQVTGAKAGISPGQIAYFERIQAMPLAHPKVIGFGIGDKKSFDTACAYANGAIIGSAFIRALEGASPDDIAGKIRGFIRSIRGV